ncbi:SDR family NAD(P)-dependent oxidoreductase [Dactylosporangium sp. NPDC051541]|uniref:SDR family NAD(P)-dependent oxidoreductase n=1 Tax=Dactylosporangium sp. NPDC051541 TaxID=3363977 RepID=UPI00379F0C04
MPDLSHRVGVVTGGGKGLGRAFALHLASLGAAIVVNNRNREVDSAGRVVAEIEAAGGRAVADYSDVADPHAGEDLVALALSAFGRLDFCVTSAAISGPAMFHKTSVDAFAAVQAVNVLGTVGVVAAAAKHMRAAGGGRIVLVASTAGLHGEPTVSAYAASKGAVIALGRTIACEGAPRGVYTNVLLPYATTQMTDAGMADRFRDSMTSESVAPVVAALVDPDGTLNGEVIVAANGSLRATSSVEWGTVRVPETVDAAGLAALLDTSRAGKPHEYRTAQDAFADFAEETLP